MFLKEKHDGRAKGIVCANGIKKFTYTNKEYVMSPTFFTEAVFMSALIEAYKERSVVCFNIPGS